MHLWTDLSVFLTWYTWPTQFQSKMWSTNNQNKWDKSKRKVCQKILIYQIFLSFLLPFYHFYLTYNINKYLLSRQNTSIYVIHSVIKSLCFYLMCTIFISDCWTSLIQSNTIWIYITIMVANMNLEIIYIYIFIILI